MKKAIAYLTVFSIVMIMLSSFAFAISYEYVSNEEQKVLASKMEDRGIIASDMELRCCMEEMENLIIF